MPRSAGVKQLDVGGRIAAVLDGRQVAAEARPVPAPLETDRRHRADADAEVVVPEPVAKVVAALVARPAKVRRLVPAVPGTAQRGDDLLVVGLHRLGLPLELAAVAVREPRARLGLELVGAHVVRPERQQLSRSARRSPRPAPEPQRSSRG